MMPPKNLVTYQDWLNELYNTNPNSRGIEAMLACAVEIAKRAPDKKTAFHDVSLVLAQMYKRATVKAEGNAILAREIKDRFDNVSITLFKMEFDKVLDYVQKSEPNFDPGANKVSLGFIQPTIVDPEKTPLGFIKATPKNGGTSLGFIE